MNLFIFLFFLPGFFTVSAQTSTPNGEHNRTIDSLNALLSSSKHDTVKLRLMVEISEVCELDDILKYALPAVTLADELIINDSLQKEKTKILKYKAEAL